MVVDSEFKSKLHILDHPLIQYKLGCLRDRETSTSEFRSNFHQLANLVAYEASRNLQHTSKEIATPMGISTTTKVESPVLVAILRAGSEMLDSFLRLLPNASAGHIGIYRDRYTQHTVEYYFRLPKEMKHKTVFLLDPNLATGSTMLATIDRLQQFEVASISILCFLVSQEGVDKIRHYYPNIDIYAAAIETGLNEQGFLIPGLGDVSNRLYGIDNEV